MQLRLTPDQIEAKKALEAAVEEVKQDLEVEDDAAKKEALQVELKDRESKLDGLMEQFEVRPCELARSCRVDVVFRGHRSKPGLQKLAVERAKSGEIGVRPSERRRQVEEAQLAAGGFAGGRPDAYGKYRNSWHPFTLDNDNACIVISTDWHVKLIFHHRLFGLLMCPSSITHCTGA